MRSSSSISPAADHPPEAIVVKSSVGGFSAFDFSHIVKNLSSTILSVRHEPVVGLPAICGVENYAIVPVDLRTTPDQGFTTIFDWSVVQSFHIRRFNYSTHQQDGRGNDSPVVIVTIDFHSIARGCFSLLVQFL